MTDKEQMTDRIQIAVLHGLLDKALNMIKQNIKDIYYLRIRLDCLVQTISGVDERDEECADTFKEEHKDGTV